MASTVDDAPAPADGTSRGLGRARRDLIALEIAQHGYVSCSGLAERLGVSEMTVRRDFRKMEQEGKLRRAHGGAVGPLAGTIDTVEPDVEDRTRTNAAEKQRIGRHAAQLCLPQHFVAVDIGSTTMCLAHSLIGRDVRFLTCSLKIATVLTAAGESVVIPGGFARGSEPSLVGALTRRQIESFRFDTVFLGVSGADTSGLFDYSLEDSEIKRTLIEQSSRVVALVDRSKFNRAGMAKVCDLAELDILITDAAPQGDLADALSAAGVTVSIASD
jgi:DeoR family glycerol-3-phosphate regulon repressor